RPDPDGPVVATAGAQVPVGADRHGPQPTLMGVDREQGLGLLGVERPGDHPALVAAAVQHFLLGMARQAAHPALVAGERRLLALLQVPALDRAALGAAEAEGPGGAVPPADEGAGVLKLRARPGRGGGEGGEGHRPGGRPSRGGVRARLWGWAPAGGGAGGLGCWWTPGFSGGSRPGGGKWVGTGCPPLPSRWVTAVPLALVLPTTAPP